MNRILLAIMLALCSVVSAQVEVVYPYNPDGNADSVISAPDLLDLLPIFGGEFTPQEIIVNGEGLSTVLEEMQSALDSLSTITNGTTAFGEKVFLDFDSMKWTMDTWEAAVFEPSTDGFLEVIPQGDQTLSLHVLVIPEELDPCAGVYDDCTFLPWTFWNSDDLSNYQYGTDHPHTIPVKQSELVYVGSGNGDIDGVGVDFKWTPLLSSSNEHSAPSEEANGPCQGELTVNYHDYDYELVEIGGQCWFAENLRYLPYVGSASDMDSKITVNGYFGTSVEDASQELNYQKYGAWYESNVWTIQDVQLCPSNFQVPSTNQVLELLSSVNDNIGSLKVTGWSEIGLSDWVYPNYGATNATGFSAKPSGYGEYPIDGTTFRMAVSDWPFAGVWGQVEITTDGGWNWNGHSGTVNVAIRCIKDQ